MIRLPSGQDGWHDGTAFQARPLLPHFVEIEEIEEMHSPEHQQHDPEFGAEEFQHALEIERLRSVPQGGRDEADVDEIKSDHEQMIHRIGHFFVAPKGLDEKHPPVAMERARDPDGHGDRNGQIEEIGNYRVVHVRVGC